MGGVWLRRFSFRMLKIKWNQTKEYKLRIFHVRMILMFNISKHFVMTSSAWNFTRAFHLIFFIKLPFFYTTQSSTALPFSSPHFILLHNFPTSTTVSTYVKAGPLSFRNSLKYNGSHWPSLLTGLSLLKEHFGKHTDTCSECKPLPKWAFPQFHRTQFLNLFIVVTFFF